MQDAGINENLTPATFKQIIPKSLVDGKIGIWKDKRIKNLEGHYDRNEDGTIKTKVIWKECKYFSIQILFLLLMQNGIMIKDDRAK